jgi:4-hydroxy-2-oxovalerate aldolase
VARISTVCTEADIGIQHLRLARELGMLPHSHLNTAHLLDPDGLVEQAKVVADAGSEAIFIVDSAGAFLTDDVRRRVAALRAALPDEVAIGMHEHNNLSLAVANSAAAVAEGATLVDTSLAGLGAGAGNCQTEVLVAVLERMGISTGIDLWTLQDVADRIVRAEVMQRPIEIDRLTATMGYASVPASYLLHAIRAGERFGLDPRDLIVELGRRRVVVGQEDAIIGIAAEMADPAAAGR